MWTSILPLGLWVQHLEWYLVLKEQIIHITCCYFYHLITVFMTHFYNKLWRNNSPPFKENENLQLGYAALLWPMTVEYFQDQVQLPWRGEETGPIVSQGMAHPEARPLGSQVGSVYTAYTNT